MSVDTGPTSAPQKVTVTDIDIPFMSMVVFMVKWAFASIPALLFLLILGAIGSVLIGGIVGGLTLANRLSSADEPRATYTSPSREPSDTRAQYEADIRAFQTECGASTTPDCATRRYVLELRDKALSR